MASPIYTHTKSAPASFAAQLFFLLVALALFGVVLVIVGVVVVICALIGTLLLGYLFLVFMCVRGLVLQIASLGKAVAPASYPQKRWAAAVLKLCVRQLIPLLLWYLWRLWRWTWSATAGPSSPWSQPRRTSSRTLSG